MYKQQLVRIGTVQKIREVLTGFGKDPEREMAKLGMSPEMFADGDLLVSVTDVARLLEHCVVVTGRPDFPLCLAARQDLSYLGTFGLLLRTATTLGAALEELTRFLHVHSQTTSINLERFEDHVVLSAFIDDVNLTPYQRDLLTDFTLAQCFRGLNGLAGDSVRLKALLLRREASNNQRAYTGFFKAPVHFKSDSDGLVLSAESLKVQIVHADPGLHNAVRQQLNRSRLIDQGDLLRQDIRAIIRSLLPSMQCNIERVARCFHCDKRTLQRRLRQLGNTSYQTLLDEVRFELAEHYLHDTDLPIIRVASALGYKDPSNFTSAFRRQYGLTPKQWRLERRS